MKVKREVVASDAMGTYVRETVHLETAREFGEYLASSQLPLPAVLAHLKEWVASKLQENGWPPIGEKVLYDRDGNWQPNDPGASLVDPALGGSWSELFIRDRTCPAPIGWSGFSLSA
jgi:hypothetical protein